MKDSETSKTFAIRFVERFDDLFDHGLFPSFALGLLLVWIWMGLSEGYPAFMDGRIDLSSVIVMLGSFAAFLLLSGFVATLRKWIGSPWFWAIGAGMATMAVFAQWGVVLLHELLEPFVTLALLRILMVFIGLGTGILVLACATAFSCLRAASSGVGFSIAIMVTFVLYFCLQVCGDKAGVALFCILPLGVAPTLFQARSVIVTRVGLEPPEKLTFSKGYVSMCVSFAVFFLAIGAKCAFEPPWEFGEGADTSIIGIMVVSMVFLYLIALKPKPMGVFHVLKFLYAAAVMILTVCIAVAPLSLEPVASIVYNADVMIIIMILWLLTTFVAHFNEVRICKVIGIAFGAAALGMLLGWTLGVLLYQLLGHDRSYPAIAIACATAAFSTVGFSSRSFPHLTRRGEGAIKMRKAVLAYEPVDYSKAVVEQYHLSGREAEVLQLLVVGYGADAISEKLVISYHTARTHVRNIYKKMDVHSQRELLDRYEAAKQEYGDAHAHKKVLPQEREES